MIRWIPIISLTLLLAATLLRGWSVKRKSGMSAWAFLSARGVQRFVGFFFAVTFVPLGLAAWHVAKSGAASGTMTLAGAVLAAAGTMFATIAQVQLGNAWRVGVREGDASLFISTGLYRFSRNPIFLGMFVMAGGIALASGSWWAWIALAVLIVSVAVQVDIEERHLSRAFGEDYARFKARVPRWIGLPRKNRAKDSN